MATDFHLFLTTINKALWNLFWLTQPITDHKMCLRNMRICTISQKSTSGQLVCWHHAATTLSATGI